MENWKLEAEHFLNNETSFHLGFLPSESRNPLSMHMDEDFNTSTVCGVKTLLACDKALIPHLRTALASPEYAEMVEAMKNARRIVFSGCGATGRLAILLESAYLEAFPEKHRVCSIMTGGDFALIRSVENFEDYPGVGKKQVEDLEIDHRDILIGITATGETASIIGSAREAALRGAKVFMLICVPADLPASRIERCRELYSMPNVTVISMLIGGMALTGSTRMQSSTIEFLVASSALERALGTEGIDYAGAFEDLMASLDEAESSQNIADMIDFEYNAYQKHELIDYIAHDLAIDILSDTTERSPTFMIPPYKFIEDESSPEPWAMLRDEDAATEDIWQKCLKRAPRCIAWKKEDYINSGLAEIVKNKVPVIDAEMLMHIPLGGKIPARQNAHKVRITNIHGGAVEFNGKKIGGKVCATPLRIFEHLRMKLVMNIISTGTMVKYGRVRGNYMIHLSISNKKLIDRATRIISELCGIDYKEACYELFRTREELAGNGNCHISAVAATIDRLTRK